jgi:hypothetical protein
MLPSRRDVSAAGVAAPATDVMGRTVPDGSGATKGTETTESAATAPPSTGGSTELNAATGTAVAAAWKEIVA